MKKSEHVFWLAVPPDQKDSARAAAGKIDTGQSGIGYDGELKLWYARPGCDLDKLKDWWPDRSRRAGGGDPEIEFSDVLAAEGLVLHGLPIMDGKRHRVATIQDKSGKKSGVYCGYLDRTPAGWFINYHTAVDEKQVTNWKASVGETDYLSQMHMRAAAQQAKEDVERERAEVHRERAQAAEQLYRILPAADPEHPYLIRKGITATEDIRQTRNGALVVPFYDVTGSFKTLQYIPPAGDKFLFKDAPKKGHFHVVGGPLRNGEQILYAEGYATARSVNMATGRPVVMTVDAGNMKEVAKILRFHYPDSGHLFLADLDHHKEVNKGLLVANAAAAEVGGQVVHPEFTDAEKAVPYSDFNDLHVSRGLEAVLSQVAPLLRDHERRDMKDLQQEHVQQSDTASQKTTLASNGNSQALAAPNNPSTLESISPGVQVAADLSIETRNPSASSQAETAPAQSGTVNTKPRTPRKPSTSKPVKSDATTPSKKARTTKAPSAPDPLNADTQDPQAGSSSPKGAAKKRVVKTPASPAEPGPDNTQATDTTTKKSRTRKTPSTAAIKNQVEPLGTARIETPLSEHASPERPASAVVNPGPDALSPHPVEIGDRGSNGALGSAVAVAHVQDLQQALAPVDNALVDEATADGSKLSDAHLSSVMQPVSSDQTLVDQHVDTEAPAYKAEAVHVANTPAYQVQDPEASETFTAAASPSLSPDPLSEDAPSLPDEVKQPDKKVQQGTESQEKPVADVDAIWVGPPRPSGELPEPAISQIDKDTLLARITNELQYDKSVLYKLDGEPAFIDRGMRLEMAEGASQSDEKVLAALLTAAQYYRGRIELTGSEAFQRKAIELIAEHQLNVSMKNPEQQAMLEAARKALQVSPASRDGVGGDAPPLYGPKVHVQPAAAAHSDSPATQGRQLVAPPVVAAPVSGADLAVKQAGPTPANAITTDLANSKPQPGGTEASDRLHVSAEAARDGVTGKVTALGTAPFKFIQTNTESTYITLRTKTGPQTYWGKELAGLIRDTRLEKGKVVTLRWLGKEPVTVNVPVKGGDGQVLHYEKKSAHRNQWSLEMHGHPVVRSGDDIGVKLAAYDVQRFGAVQHEMMARMKLDIPLPNPPIDGLFWMTPDGQASAKTGDNLTAPRPAVDPQHAGLPVMSSWSEDGHLEMALVRSDGPYLQGVVRHEGELKHVLVSLPNREDAPPMVFNLVSDSGMTPIGVGNGINRSGGESVSRENIAFRLDGDSVTRIGKLDRPAEVPPALHARLGFDERWRDDSSLPKSAPAAAPTAQPSTYRPA